MRDETDVSVTGADEGTNLTNLDRKVVRFDGIEIIDFVVVVATRRVVVVAASEREQRAAKHKGGRVVFSGSEDRPTRKFSISKMLMPFTFDI